jgi:hypothetical protein
LVCASRISTILGDGALHLHPGDGVAMPGVNHAARAGPDGARVMSISVGFAAGELRDGARRFTR